MSQPHKCPVCEGEGTRHRRGYCNTAEKCHACNGTGIVWEPETTSWGTTKTLPSRGEGDVWELKNQEQPIVGI